MTTTSTIWLIWGAIGILSAVLVLVGMVMARRDKDSLEGNVGLWETEGSEGTAETHEVDYVITYEDLTWLDGACGYKASVNTNKKEGGKMACKGKKSKKGKK